MDDTTPDTKEPREEAHDKTYQYADKHVKRKSCLPPVRIGKNAPCAERPRFIIGRVVIADPAFYNDNRCKKQHEDAKDDVKQRSRSHIDKPSAD